MRDLTGLRIGLLTASASRLGGGVFEAVAAQAALIREAGGDAPVFALDDAFAATDADRFAPGTVDHLRVSGPAAIGFAPGLIDTLIAADLDILHLHGIWMYPSRAAERWAARTGRPLVISPHGMLAPLIISRGRAKKFAARLGYERRSWRRARLFHACCAREVTEINQETRRREVMIIPNIAPSPQPSRLTPPLKEVLYIGRIDPKKNIPALLAGWAQVSPAFPNSRLTIAGAGKPDYVEEVIATLKTTPQASFVGPAYADTKRELLARARFAILPSLSEGMPIAILDAWSAGLPTIMSAACNLEIGFSKGAAIECGTSPESIATALTRALACPDDEWMQMTQAARQLVNGPFAAATVAAHWCAVYRALLGGQSKDAA